MKFKKFLIKLLDRVIISLLLIIVLKALFLVNKNTNLVDNISLVSVEEKI